LGYLSGELEFSTALANLDKMPKQKEFVTALVSNTSPYFSAAYYGGQGSGKSVSLCTAAITNCLVEPNGLSFIGRLNMPALETTTMRTFLEMVDPKWGDWQEAKKIWTFKNGHDVIFRHLDITDPKVVGHIKSLNLSRAYIDEGSEVPEEVYFLLIGRMRRKTAKRRTIGIASNPAGHDWGWRHFFDPTRKKDLREKNLGVTASTMENCFLPAEYVENMLSTYPPDWADRFIYGSFADFSDLVFKEFTEPSHAWDDTKHWEVFGGERVPPDDWPIIVGMDIGGGEEGDPWAIPIIAVAPDGRLYQFAEVYGSGLRIKPIADQLHELMGRHPLDGIAYDYAQRAAALELEEHGIGGQPAIKEVRPGLFKTEQYVHVDPRLRHPFNENISGSPRFFISASCKHSIREMAAYKWAKDRSGNPKFEPAHENSHSPSAIRYAIHTFRPDPKEIIPAKKWERPGVPLQSRIYWQQKEVNDDRQKKIERWRRTPFLSTRRGVSFERDRTVSEWTKR
jgi:hypothetical protein